jgi:hypothetical protein
VLIYALAWLIVPLDTETTNIFSRAVNDRRGIRLVIAVIPLVIVTQIVVSLLHVGFVGIISWPVFLAAGLTILIWRNASEPERVWMHNDLVPMLSVGSEGPGRWKLILRTTGRRSWPPGASSCSSWAIPAPPPCARSAGPCWSSRPSWSSSVPGG